MSRLLRRDRGRGQALVEFALVVPILFLLLFAIIDVSRYVYSWNALNEASRAGARAGSVSIWPPDCSGLTREACVKTIAKNRITAVSLALGDVTVQCQRRAPNGTLSAVATDNCNGSWRANDIMTVTITKDFTLLTPVFAQILPSLTMTGQTTVTVD
ncbi:MAG TPA: TadE/TadG family type IV pilus assembly protein [Candidatus Limnocylindrales bacterium]|jgi:Flp pilus assembly protein TadG